MAELPKVPASLLEAMASLRLPPKLDLRRQLLMDRNSNGTLTPAEREELEAWVEWSETLAPLRAQALRLLGRKPA